MFSDAAIHLCLSIKVLFKRPLRQTAGMVASVLRQTGLDWPVQDFSTLSRRQKTLAVRIHYRLADGPLKRSAVLRSDYLETETLEHGSSARGCS